jgi:hypothetical protein
VAGFDDILYNGTFSGLSAEINAVGFAWQARGIEGSTSRALDIASELAGQFHSQTVADVLDIPYSTETAMRDINAARVRMNAAFAAIDSVPDEGEIPPQYAGEIKASLNSAWAEAFTVAGEAESLPSLAAEISKVTQNLRESRTVLPEILAPVADTIGAIIDKILKALTSKLWPWLLVAGLVFLIVEFAPELRLLVAGVIKSKTPGGA